MKIAKLILDYQNRSLTENVLKIFPDAIVVNQGNNYSYNNEIRLEENKGFTLGWNLAIQRILDDYDSFWLMNNDIVTGSECITELEKVLESHPRLGIVSPYCNSPHSLMHKKTQNSLRYTPFVEFVCPAIRKEVFAKIGYFDEVFSKGWGVEFDYCWKARRNGFSVGVYDLVGVNHLEHSTIDKVGREDYFSQAAYEMNTYLAEKYGNEWKAKLEEMIALNMVVCNEGNRLEEMIDYHRNLVDEIVIAVQESDDNTLDLAYQLADTVIPTKRSGYCESDRSIVSTSTNSEWQLVLDADEYLTEDFINVMREKKEHLGYRLTRRLIEDGIFRFEGDMQHRFFHKSNVKFLDELHTEPQAKDWNWVTNYPFVSINHIKTLDETIADEQRYQHLLETTLRNDPLRERKMKLNIHL
jgi:hypothetical protein